MRKIVFETVTYEELLRDVQNIVRETFAPLMEANEAQDPLLTRKQAAMILGVSTQTIDNYRKQRKLKSSFVGGCVRIKKSDLTNLS